MTCRHAAGLVLACLLAACGDTARPAATAPIVVDYTLADFSFQGPDTIPAGPVVFRFNLAGAEPHVMNFIRLDDGKGLADLMAAGESAFDSTWVHPEPGGITITHGDAPLYSFSLAPGRYVLLCYFHAADGMPHFAKGMVKEVVVAGPVTATPPATPVAQVDLVDFGFTIDTPIPAGAQTIRVVNVGKEPHEVIIKRLPEAVSLEAGRAWADSAPDKRGPSPWTSWGGVNMEPGDTAYMHATFPKGHYRLICMFMMPGDSLNHAGKGMDTYITVN